MSSDVGENPIKSGRGDVISHVMRPSAAVTPLAAHCSPGAAAAHCCRRCSAPLGGGWLERSSSSRTSCGTVSPGLSTISTRWLDGCVPCRLSFKLIRSRFSPLRPPGIAAFLFIFVLNQYGGKTRRKKIWKCHRRCSETCRNLSPWRSFFRWRISRFSRSCFGPRSAKFCRTSTGSSFCVRKQVRTVFNKLYRRFPDNHFPGQTFPVCKYQLYIGLVTRYVGIRSVYWCVLVGLQ